MARQAATSSLILALAGVLSCLPVVRASFSKHQRWILSNSFLKYKANSAYCASVREGKVTEGSDIILWHCDKASGFQWEIDGNLIKLKEHPDYCLKVRDEATGWFGGLAKAENGADILLGKCRNGPSFQWVLDGEHVKFKADPRYWLSVRKNEGRDGADLILWQGNDENSFRWKIDGPLIRVDSDPDRCLGVREGKAGDGSNVILWTCNEKADDFKWKIVGDQIRYAANPKYCLSVREGKAQDGQDVLLWSCSESEHFNWIVDGQHIRYKSSPDYCASIREGRSGDGADVILWMCEAPKEKGVEISHKGSMMEYPGEFKWDFDGNRLRSRNDPRYCASVREGKVVDGQDVIMWHCGSTDEFHWVVEEHYIKLKADPNYCMSVSERPRGGAGIMGGVFGEENRPIGAGSYIVISPCGRTQAFRWTISDGSIAYRAEPKYHLTVKEGQVIDGGDLVLGSAQAMGAAPFQFIFEEMHLKLKADPRYCVSVRQGRSAGFMGAAGAESKRYEPVGDGSDIVLMRCGTTDEFLWSFVGEQIRFDADQHYCLSVRESSAKDGQDVILWTCDDSDGFKWVVVNERIRFKAANKHYCLSAQEGRAGDGTPMIVWSCDEPFHVDDEL